MAQSTMVQPRNAGDMSARNRLGGHKTAESLASVCRTSIRVSGYLERRREGVKTSGKRAQTTNLLFGQYRPCPSRTAAQRLWHHPERLLIRVPPGHPLEQTLLIS